MIGGAAEQSEGPRRKRRGEKRVVRPTNDGDALGRERSGYKTRNIP